MDFHNQSLGNCKLLPSEIDHLNLCSILWSDGKNILPGAGSGKAVILKFCT